ncbi:MAG: hypothetical protein A3I11_08510 [Elusimicrobia bacterium RIFCSPLOWO2_02_FULL_39_32]|nr:MAG: hypothetical protein A2034_04215 [Elusimicrobia bacterium GWA2_38_7]OGR79309.1 MAG: hypothetical protein A3B80_08775 [Elusimicrobia bacterium RIFCSPHIGHO2_02_FULL_39_36]OGR93210.1 MAG: hypothetical protein A3I11_08510 [Elusimicrobia bacterium RIFCSPLOWO2_02_FULL_39_32]OGR99435.1 MAG: hypothetical protein A3G85_06955 [Elusimicrobia bacterium RIFCSPLOWO2_12_FULL_39_28]
MFKLNRSLQRKFDLLYLLTYKEITLKYKRTVLGIFWSLLNPIFSALVFMVAFKIFMRFKIENYTFFLLSALFPWNWFLSSITISARSLVDNVTLIKKVIFPRQYLIISVILAQLVHLFFSMPILFVFSLYSNHGISFLAWGIGIPLIILIQFVFTFGVSLIISISNTFYRDIEYLIAVLINLAFWMTPITYPMSSIPEKFRSLFLLNPLTSIMSVWRGLLFENKILWDYLFIALGIAIALLTLGTMIFKKMEKRLDEVL